MAPSKGLFAHTHTSNTRWEGRFEDADFHLPVEEERFALSLSSSSPFLLFLFVLESR